MYVIISKDAVHHLTLQCNHLSVFNVSLKAIKWETKIGMLNIPSVSFSMFDKKKSLEMLFKMSKLSADAGEREVSFITLASPSETHRDSLVRWLRVEYPEGRVMGGRHSLHPGLGCSRELQV